MKNYTKISKLSVFCGAFLLLITMASAGCYFEIDDDVIDAPITYKLADLRVNWALNYSSSPSLCSDYGINKWIVEVRGAEDHDIEIDCMDNYWTTDSALYSIREGNYTVNIRAVDYNYETIALVGTSYSLWDRLNINTLTINFFPADFQF